MIERKVLEASFVRHEPPPKDLVERPSHIMRKVALFLLLLMAVAVALWVRDSQRTHLKEIMLRQQLWQLRNAVMVYHAKHGALPKNLEVLLETAYADPVSGKKVRLVENVGKDEQGRVVGPLGYPYDYDPVMGTIKSQAPCCRDW
jgi:hypothetical protein